MSVFGFSEFLTGERKFPHLSIFLSNFVSMNPVLILASYLVSHQYWNRLSARQSSRQSLVCFATNHEMVTKTGTLAPTPDASPAR